MTGKPKKKDEFSLGKGTYQLEKFPGKGGWTYLTLPAPEGLPKSAFGNLRVRGQIDDHHFAGLSIWSANKKTSLFFPVNAGIRKIIGKKAGDTVRVVFFLDITKTELPEDFREVLNEEAEAKKKFDALSPGKQRQMISQINSAKSIESRITRMAEALKTLSRH